MTVVSIARFRIRNYIFIPPVGNNSKTILDCNGADCNGDQAEKKKKRKRRKHRKQSNLPSQETSEDQAEDVKEV